VWSFRHFCATGALLVTLCLSACNKSSTPTTPTSTTSTTATTTSVAVSGEPLLTGVGQRSQYTATATLSDATTPDVTRSGSTWTSSNTGVAVVSASGVVTTVANGVTTVTATYQGMTGSQDVTVQSVTTTFRGTASQSDGRRGTFTLIVRGAVIAASAPTSAPVSGSLQLAGAEAIALTGFYAAYTGMLSVSGFSGGGLTFAGSVANGVLTGTYTGPNGITGTFASQTSTVS
jgi:Bacterial Ig-like domain (group 2)